MRFNTAAIVTGVLAATTTAIPSENIVKRNTTSVDVLQFAAQQDGCSIFSCAGVIIHAICVIGAIEAGQIQTIGTCVSGGLPALCDCADCIPGLKEFLHSNGVC